MARVQSLITVLELKVGREGTPQHYSDPLNPLHLFIQSCFKFSVCDPLCGPNGECTKPDLCTCKEGWEGALPSLHIDPLNPLHCVDRIYRDTPSASIDRLMPTWKQPSDG